MLVSHGKRGSSGTAGAGATVPLNSTFDNVITGGQMAVAGITTAVAVRARCTSAASVVVIAKIVLVRLAVVPTVAVNVVNAAGSSTVCVRKPVADNVPFSRKMPLATTIFFFSSTLASKLPLPINVSV